MATAVETTDIAVLKTKVDNIDKVIARVESKIDAQTDLYVTRTEFNEFKQRWFLSHTLAGLAGGVLTGVVIYIINNISK